MRTAIFGGTFDPIHSAHLEMARRAAEQFGLDRVLFIPAGNPPHKHADASFEHRYRMVELACAADRRFVASRLEERSAKSYSIDTIERVKAMSAAAPNAGGANAAAPNATAPSAPSARSATTPQATIPQAAIPRASTSNAAAPNADGNGALFFIIGSDAFAEIQTWRRWEDVIQAVEFIVVGRPGHEIAGPPGARVHRLDSVELPVSSSDIRDALARGEAPPELPSGISEYIRDHRLYGPVS